MGSQREKCKVVESAEKLDLEETRLASATRLCLLVSTCAIGDGGGIPMPAKKKYKK